MRVSGALLPLLAVIIVLLVNQWRGKPVVADRIAPITLLPHIAALGLVVGGVCAWWGMKAPAHGYQYRGTSIPWLYLVVGIFTGVSLSYVAKAGASFKHLFSDRYLTVRSYVWQALAVGIAMSLLQLMCWNYFVRFDGETLETSGFFGLSTDICSASEIEELVVVSHRVVPSGQRKLAPHLFVICDGQELDFHPLLGERYGPLVDAILRARNDLKVHQRD